MPISRAASAPRTTSSGPATGPRAFHTAHSSRLKAGAGADSAAGAGGEGGGGELSAYKHINISITSTKHPPGGLQNANKKTVKLPYLERGEITHYRSFLIRLIDHEHLPIRLVVPKSPFGTGGWGRSVGEVAQLLYSRLLLLSPLLLRQDGGRRRKTSGRERGIAAGRRGREEIASQTSRLLLWLGLWRGPRPLQHTGIDGREGGVKRGGRGRSEGERDMGSRGRGGKGSGMEG